MDLLAVLVDLRAWIAKLGERQQTVGKGGNVCLSLVPVDFVMGMQ
jgi:hypothetical protein